MSNGVLRGASALGVIVFSDQKVGDVDGDHKLVKALGTDGAQQGM